MAPKRRHTWKNEKYIFTVITMFESKCKIIHSIEYISFLLTIYFVYTSSFVFNILAIISSTLSELSRNVEYRTF